MAEIERRMGFGEIERALDGYEMDARVIWYSQGESVREPCALRMEQVAAPRAELADLLRCRELLGKYYTMTIKHVASLAPPALEEGATKPLLEGK